MVTVHISWDGTDETMNERFNHVKKVITNLGCKPASPVETYDMDFICGDVIVDLVSITSVVTVYVKGIDKDVFSFAIPIVEMINNYIREHIEKGEWNSDNYETRVSLDLYEVETTCRCES